MVKAKLTPEQIAANKKELRKKTKFVSSAKWIPYIQKNFPGLLPVYNSVPEIATIIKNAYLKGQPDTEIAALINSSAWANQLQSGEWDYIKGTTTGNRQFADSVVTTEKIVRDAAKQAGYTLPEDVVRQLSANALKGGWQADKINEEVSRAVVGQAQTGAPMAAAEPSEATPTSLQTGQDAATIRSTALSYGIKLTDTQVEGYVQSILNQGLSAQQVKDQFRNQAKSLYPSVSTQLDSGTLDDATSSYRSIAANVLGVDATSIDFSDPNKFGKLLTYQDPKSGESRLMNSTEWNNYLRRLPEWQKTSEASTRYDSLIKTVDNLFQKVR